MGPIPHCSIAHTHYIPCSLSQPLSWIKPMKGAIPVPGPIMITGLLGLNGRRNWDLRMYMGTVDLWPLSVTSLFFSQLVATPLLLRPVLVLYSTTTAQMWMLLGWTYGTIKDYKQPPFSELVWMLLLAAYCLIKEHFFGGGAMLLRDKPYSRFI